MVLGRALIAIVWIAGCSQSLFDNSQGGGDDATTAAKCKEPCIANAGGDFNGTAGGSTGAWRYLDDHRDRTWEVMSEGPTMTGASGSMIRSCKNVDAAACKQLPGGLLFTPAGGAATADPAIELTAPADHNVELSLAVFVPSGQPGQVVRLYRNSREDILLTQTVLADALAEQTLTLDLLAGDRILVAVAPTAEGAADVGLQLFISGTATGFPGECQIAVPFDAVTNLMVANRCNPGPFTHDTFSGMTPNATLAAGPFPEQGMAADFSADDYYIGLNTIERNGDTTIQFWVRQDAQSTEAAWPFSDLDLDMTGGVGVALFSDAGTLKLDVETCTGVSPLMFANQTAVYPTDLKWHFIRVVHSGGNLTGCIDGRRQFSFPVPGSLKSTYPPRIARNVVWTPAGAFLDGGVDDVRVINAALPCDN